MIYKYLLESSYNSNGHFKVQVLFEQYAVENLCECKQMKMKMHIYI